MNYKKLIPSQELRIKILSLMDFIPDKSMIKLQYRIAMGRKLNLKKPERFTEKLQWYKLNYRDPLMTKCADKYRVREYVTEKGYEHILIPLYGIYNDESQIDFEKLPKKFVMKTTNGSHTNILCEDKSKLNISETKETINEWLTKRSTKLGREWPYYNIKPRVICEKYLPKDKSNDLVDYKFVCFSGRVECVFVNAERESDEIMKFGIYSREFDHLPYKRKGLRDTDSNFPKPLNYDKMIEIAESLSEEFPHVRVDLYNIEGKIYFGEMTFFHGSGYTEFEPDEFDLVLGKYFKLPIQ